MTSLDALRVAPAIWRGIAIGCSESVDGVCRVERVGRRGECLEVLAAGPTWEVVFAKARRKVPQQGSLL